MTEHDKRYRQAGILLKASIFMSVSSLIYNNQGGLEFDQKWFLVFATTSVSLVIAHFVQMGKRWTKIPVLVMTALWVVFVVYSAFFLYETREFTALSISTVQLILAIWATVLIFTPPPDGSDPFNEIILDRD